MNKTLWESKSLQAFIASMERKLKGYGGELRLVKSKHIAKDVSAIGEFDATDGAPKIIVAIKNPAAVGIGTLMHECGHFHQWMENSPIWKCFWNIDRDIRDLFTKDMGKNASKNFCNKILKIELDADKRAVKLMEKYRIPIDIDDYIKRSNLILFKWAFFRDYGRWPKSTYRDESRIIANSVGRFHRSYQTIPDSVAAIFR